MSSKHIKVIKKTNNRDQVPDPDIKEVTIYDYTYVDADKIRLPDVIIKEYHNNKGTIRYHSINYKYHDTVQNQMNILFSDLKLHPKIGGVGKYDNITMYCDFKDDSFHRLEDLINLIKNKTLNYFEQNEQDLDLEDLKRVKGKRLSIYMKMKHSDKFCRIIKLGPKSSGNVNTEITCLEDFNKLIDDYRYNKSGTDRYFIGTLLLSFRTLLYKHNDADAKWRVSFKPYIKLMEVRFSKAKCVSVISREEKVVITNNVLSL